MVKTPPRFHCGGRRFHPCGGGGRELRSRMPCCAPKSIHQWITQNAVLRIVYRSIRGGSKELLRSNCRHPGGDPDGLDRLGAVEVEFASRAKIPLFPRVNASAVLASFSSFVSKCIAPAILLLCNIKCILSTGSFS